LIVSQKINRFPDQQEKCLIVNTISSYQILPIKNCRLQWFMQIKQILENFKWDRNLQRMKQKKNKKRRGRNRFDIRQYKD
jgi:hypothetical protein